MIKVRFLDLPFFFYGSLGCAHTLSLIAARVCAHMDKRLANLRYLGAAEAVNDELVSALQMEHASSMQIADAILRLTEQAPSKENKDRVARLYEAYERQRRNEERAAEAAMDHTESAIAALEDTR